MMYRFRSILFVVPLILSNWVFAADNRSNSFDSALSAVGRIMSDDGKTRIGTGFVAGDSHNIFLPAHVGIAETLSFKPYRSDFTYRIALKYVLPDYDLAIYQRTGGKQDVSLILGDMDRLRPGDSVMYLGWESDKSLAVQIAMVAAKGETLDKGGVIGFIDFEGYGKPGFSGGPVLNKNGEVVAMIVQGADHSAIVADSSGIPPKTRVIRAYSVDLLSVLETKVRNSISPTTVSQESEMSLMERLGGSH